VANVTGTLVAFVRRYELGRVLTGDVGFILRRNPDAVRAPDVAFMSNERAARVTRWRGYLEVPPDLVVEVISPSNTQAEMQSKVHDWFEFGVRLVWLVYPDTRSVQVVRSLQERLDLTESATLDGYDVIPGFACQVSELFD
jgi:Uma2 family endonuclease